jgi:hypothetical protein
LRAHGKGKYEFKKDGVKHQPHIRNRDIFIQLERDPENWALLKISSHLFTLSPFSKDNTLGGVCRG